MVVAWNHRYEAVPNVGQLTLEHLRDVSPTVEGVAWSQSAGQSKVHLTKIRRGTGPTLNLPLPDLVRCDAVHLRYRIQASRLLAGAREMQDGGLNLIWTGPDTCQLQRVAGVSNGLLAETESLICPAPSGAQRVNLQLDHRGLTGEFEVSDLELVMLQLRGWCYPVLGLLLLGGWGWLILAIRAASGHRLWRVGLASILVLVVFLGIVVPGPWILKKPLVSERFPIGPLPVAQAGILKEIPHEIPAASAGTEAFNHSMARQAPRETVQDNPVLFIKRAFRPVKSLFHALFFGGLAFGLAVLVGVHTAWVSCALLAIASELAQVAFRFGVGLDEFADLAMNALGIAFGCLMAKRLWPAMAGWWRGRRKQVV